MSSIVQMPSNIRKTPVESSERPARTQRARRGIAAVEVAVMLPLVVMLVLGAIDVGRGIGVQHTLTDAARAGCRVYSVKDAQTYKDAINVIDTIMNEAGLTGYVVNVDPPTTNDIVHMEPVSLTVSVPYSDVSWFSGQFMSGKTLSATCTMPGDNWTGEE